MPKQEPGEHRRVEPRPPRHGGHVFRRLHGARVEAPEEPEGSGGVRRGSHRGVERVQAHLGFVTIDFCDITINFSLILVCDLKSFRQTCKKTTMAILKI